MATWFLTLESLNGAASVPERLTRSCVNALHNGDEVQNSAASVCVDDAVPTLPPSDGYVRLNTVSLKTDCASVEQSGGAYMRD